MKKNKKALSGEALKNRIINTVKDLPPMPQTVLKAREIMADKKSSFKELGKVLETDQAIATAVLKFANSAYYGLSGKVSSIHRASVVLGHKTIGELISIAGTCRILGRTLAGYDLDAGELWKHSLAVAQASKLIANQKNPGLTNDAFTTGLIHDAGKLILDPYILERKKEFQQIMANEQISFLEAEKKILGFDHAQIAAEVCKKWNIPSDLTNAIRYHHYPSRSKGTELVYIIHIADAISMMTAMGLGIDGMSYQMDDKAIAYLKLKEDEITNIMTETISFVENIIT